MKNKKYYVEDIETGYPHEVTKEQHDAYHNALNHFSRPLHTNDKVGQIIVYGTGGDLDDKSYDLKDIFYNSEYFKTKDIPDNAGHDIKS